MRSIPIYIYFFFKHAEINEDGREQKAVKYGKKNVDKKGPLGKNGSKSLVGTYDFTYYGSSLGSNGAIVSEIEDYRAK